MHFKRMSNVIAVFFYLFTFCQFFDTATSSDNSTLQFESLNTNKQPQFLLTSGCLIIVAIFSLCPIFAKG